MSDDLDEEAERAFRPARRPAWIAMAANATLAVVLLGIPYARGRLRANDAADHFARLAQCLYGGEPVDSPGLALPAGDRERFAARVERAGEEWPASCAEELQAMRPDPVIFLFPTPKQAEEDLRRAIDQADAELVALQRARAGGGIGAVPERPLRAITQLRGALANALQASDVQVDPTAPAFALDVDPSIVRPSRIPLHTASGGAIALRPELGGLRVIASDARGVAEIVVDEGSVAQVQVRRPAAVRGIALGPAGGFLLWITSESTCSSDPARCAGRLLGVAAMPEEDDGEPSPRWWLAAHPARRIDRALRFELGAVWVMAVADDGVGTDVRRFELDPAAPPPASGEELAPLTTTRTQSLGRVADAIFVPGGAIWAWRQEGQLRIDGVGLSAAPSPDGEPGMMLPTAGEGAPRQVALARCGQWTAAATPEGISLAHGGAAFPPIARPLRAPILGASPADDAVRLACHDAGVDVVAIDRQRRVVRWACTPEGCAAADVIASGASQLDAAHGGGTTIVAWTGDVQHPQIRVARVRGRVVGAPEVPAPCWDSGEGMCGAPYVVADGGRMLIAARENADLMVLEVAPDAFRPLDGL